MSDTLRSKNPSRVILIVKCYWPSNRVLCGICSDSFYIKLFCWDYKYIISELWWLDGCSHTDPIPNSGSAVNEEQIRLVSRVWAELKIRWYEKWFHINVFKCVSGSQISTKYKYQWLPRNIQNMFPMDEEVWHMGHIWPHSLSSVNTNASRCIPDKDVTGKYVINARCGGWFGESMPTF